MSTSDREESKSEFASQHPEESADELRRAAYLQQRRLFLQSQVRDLCRSTCRGQRRERSRAKFFVLSRSQLATRSSLLRQQLDPLQLQLGLDPDPLQALWDLLRRSALLSSLSQDRASFEGHVRAYKIAKQVLCPDEADLELQRAQEHDRLHLD